MRALNRSEALRATRILHHVSKGEGATVLAEARLLAEEAPDSPDAWHALALCLAQSERVEEADQAFLRVLRIVPRQSLVLANRARFLKQAGLWSTAIECWRELIDLRPSDPQVWLELGLLQLDLAMRPPFSGSAGCRVVEKRSDAIASLRRAAELDPSLVRAWQALAHALSSEEKVTEAEAVLRRGLSLDPGQATLWVSLAKVLRLSGRPEEAVAAHSEAERLGATEPAAMDAFIGALVDCLRIEEALERAHRLVEVNPEYIPGYRTLAQLNWEYGAEFGGEGPPDQFFHSAVDERRNDVPLELGLVRFLMETHRGEEAFDRLQRLRESDDSPRLVALQAVALESTSDVDRAARLFAEAESRLPEWDISFNNAYVRHLLRTGQERLAAERAQRTLEVDPFNQEALAYLATSWRLQNDTREDWLCGYDQLADLVAVEVPKGWSDMNAFLADLREALEPLHQARSEPMSQSVRSGSQTPGRLFGRPDPRISALEVSMRNTVEQWVADLPCDTSLAHPFLSRRARSVRFTGSWSVRLRGSGHHANHFHSDGWLSSAFYVALPPTVQGITLLGGSNSDFISTSRPGSLQLGQPPDELGLELGPRRVIHPVAGFLALFPSFLWHGTLPFEDPEPRVTVAFDMLPSA